MAVSKENSLFGKASDFYEDISEVCQPCSVEGKRLESERFCVGCQEYLCLKCSTHHKALKATRTHVLVAIDDAKNAKPVTANDKCSLKCSHHKYKSIEYFCVTHSYLGCSVCFTTDHTHCNSIDYIPKVAKDIISYDGFKKFNEKLKSLETICIASIGDVVYNLEQIETDKRQLKEALAEFREKMNNAFDNFEKELTSQAKEINIDETNKLNGLSKKLETSLANVDTLINQVDTLLSSGKQCDIYVLMKKKESHLVSLNDELVNTTKGKTYQRYELQPNTGILKTGLFGKLSSRKETVSCSFEKTMSSTCTYGSSKITVNVPSQSTDDPSTSKLIQPGCRVRNAHYFSFGGGGGTVECHDRSRGQWKVNWDDGGTGFHNSRHLRIVEK